MAFGNDPQAFPMMIVPLEVLIAMTRMQSHEELMDAGALVNFQCLTLGKVMFVLHQWIARHHPDPDFEQLAEFAESAAEFDQYGCCWEAKDGQIWWSSHAAAVSREEMSQSGL